MTPDERAELERQLVAELAAVAIDDGQGDADDEEDDEQGRYVRLDLDHVLRSTNNTGASSSSLDAPSSSWRLLVASVAQCDALVFQAFALEMHELQTDILPALATAAAQASTNQPPQKVIETIRRGPSTVDDAVTLLAAEWPHTIAADPCHGHDRSLLHVNGDCREAPRLWSTGEQPPEEMPTPTPTPTLTVALDAIAIEDSRVPSNVDGQDRLDPALVGLDTRQHLVAPPPHLDDATPTQLSAEEPTGAAPSLSTLVEPTVESETDTGGLSIARLPSVSLCSKREAMMMKAQEEMDEWLAQEQLRWEEEHKAREERWREEGRERHERDLMQREELATRAAMEHQRRQRELLAMHVEDRLSQDTEALYARESLRARQEQQRMAMEEARTRRRLRQERERQRQEKLVEEASRVRRYHYGVIEELVARVETKRRANDLERRRALRESSDMRREEHWMRRLVVQARALKELAERKIMETEDRLVRRRMQMEWEEGRRRIEEQEIKLMGVEDDRSRVWETLGRLRIKRVGSCVGSWRRHQLVGGWSRWRKVVASTKEAEANRHELELVANRRREAAGRIQRCVRRWLGRRRPMTTSEEKLAAARMLQSAFRGFHVRRKFQNALELARAMGGDGEDDEFGEVNLEDLIEAPPELADDWEQPTIPRYVRTTNMVEEEEGPECDQDGESGGEEMEEGEGKRLRAYPLQPLAPDRLPPTPTPTNQPEHEPTNLAAVIWNRMRRKKQKQEHKLEERKKEQDPTYRVQKLLLKTTNANTNTNNQHADSSRSSASTHQPTPTVTWSTATDKKKAPKVNVPSLVERLRKKTAAAR